MNTPVFAPRIVAFALLLSGAVAVLSAADKPRPWPPNSFQPLSSERISALPAAERAEWIEYWEKSRALAEKMPARRAPEASPLRPLSGPPKGGAHTRGLKRGADAAWFAGAEAAAVANRIVARQALSGGWNKGNDYTRDAAASPEEDDSWSNGTFDNDATISELRFLAQATAAAPGRPEAEAWRASFLKGLRYCFSAQYPNGGFPQIYPLVGGYHDNITYNDDAMVQVLVLLRDVAEGAKPFEFVPDKDRAEAATRLRLGVDCILATQVRNDEGRLTAWDQQYDALMLGPAAARNFEPICLCSGESAELVRFLMSFEKPSPAVVQAIESAVVWFRTVEIHNAIWDKFGDRGGLVPSPGAPPLWARMYEIGTNKPIFGDRDRTVHYAVEEISAERRAGYSWYGDWPASVLNAYPAWKEKQRQ